ncbi:hypothetical protein ScPMuIL_015090 [Solemya velum]
MLQDHPEKEKDFVTLFRIERPFTAKKKFVKKGKNEEKQYVMPQPHDFRQYPSIKKMGLPQFSVDYEKDPFDINFHTKRLNTIHGGFLDTAVDRDIRGRQMAPPKSPQPKFDREWILDSEPYPIKTAAYTRYPLKYRPPRSAFLERVTTCLHNKWTREQFDSEIQNALLQAS